MLRRCLVLPLLLVTFPIAAAEISTNGLGGGLWSAASTWRGGKVPTGDDDIVIRKFDVVTFDRNDDSQTSCRKIQIDPKGGLQFKTGVGKVVMVVADILDCYGTIKIDGTKSANDVLELRMAGETSPQRHLKLGKGAGLLLYGRADLKDGKRNVLVHGVIAKDSKGAQPALVEVEGFAAIDWQRVHFKNVRLTAKKLDNTGVKPNERINVVDNSFEGLSRLLIQSCDTPIVSKNSFHYDAKEELDAAAIAVSGCPLAEIKNNTIRGSYKFGVDVGAQTDCSIVGNSFEEGEIGLYSLAGSTDLMVKQNRFRKLRVGIALTGASGVIEDAEMEEVGFGLQFSTSTLQVTKLVVKKIDKMGAAVHHLGGNLTLLNCDLQPSDLKIPDATLKAGTALVTNFQYVVLAVKGAKEGTVIDLRTKDPKLDPEVADPNVRNTPAALVEGLSPLPRTFNSLIVRTWSLDGKGKQVPAPEYVLKILGPAPKEGDDRPVLKTVPFVPPEAGFRSSLDDPRPSLEVSLK